MKQFMIGQYGSFDYNKYENEFREDFYGIEACMFSTHEDYLRLIEESRKRGFHVGIHFPIRADASKARDALFMSSDKSIREDAFHSIQDELDYLAILQPTYILFHYPKPVILDDRVSWDNWKFSNSSEYILESQFSMEELIERTDYLFRWITEKAEQYCFIPVLEFDALNRYIYETSFLEEWLEKFPKIKLCLDTGRLFLQEKIDPYFDSRAILRKYTKYAASIHLSTVQVKDGIQYKHFPVLPELTPLDGWAPIEDYLNIIKEENNKVTIMFEHRSDLISKEQLDQCYTWVDHILNNSDLLLTPSEQNP